MYNIARLRNPGVSKNFSIALGNMYEALGNIDEEAERDADSAWWIAKESYLHATYMCAREEKEKKEITTGYNKCETWYLINKSREIDE